MGVGGPKSELGTGAGARAGAVVATAARLVQGAPEVTDSHSNTPDGSGVGVGGPKSELGTVAELEQ